MKLTVFAAAWLQGAFTNIGKAYSVAHPNVTVTFNFAGSDALATQITQGAPADVFASANAAQMNVVVTGGEVAPRVKTVCAQSAGGHLPQRRIPRTSSRWRISPSQV